MILLPLAAFALVVGGLAWSKHLPGNGFIGLKIKEVRSSREIWDAAHAAAGPSWVLAGVILAFGGLLSMRFDALIFWLITIIALLFALVVAGIGANLGARVAVAAKAAQDAESGCGDSCNCGSSEAAPDAPAVDVEALRAAMKNYDS